MLRIFLAVSLAAAFISCRHEAETLVDLGSGTGGGGNGGVGGAACDPAKIYFQQQVLPILISNCAMSGCHDVASHEDGVILTSFEYVMSTGGVRPGDPGNSDLYEMIVEPDPDDRMPPAPRPRLPDDQVNLIRTWIQQGAQNLSCATLCDSSVFSYSAAIRPIISNKCQGCHQGSAASGGIVLSDYTSVLVSVGNGSFWGAVNHLPGFSPMPRNANKLSDCELSQIRKWIDAGAPNN